MQIAVVGSGIAGLGASWCLSAEHEVTLYESESRLGGHSRTLEVDLAGSLVNVDTGFIVYNERNYPNLTELFKTLGVATSASDMSFGVSVGGGSFEYAGRVGGLFTKPRAVFSRRAWGILFGILRFRGEAGRLEACLMPDDVSVSRYLADRGFPTPFIEDYLLPLASAVWSATRNDARAMPAATFLQFLNNHGLIRVTDRPPWRTVAGGSRTYVDHLAKKITRIHTARRVTGVARNSEGVTISDSSGAQNRYDHVVFATHADTTLHILGDNASPAERRVLSRFGYDKNEVVLHTDESVMPTSRRAWSAWNVKETINDDGSEPVAVSYWMNRLQHLETDTNVFVTLNPGDSIRPASVIDRWSTMHPQFDLDAQRAQKELPSIQGVARVWFAGAYHGHGFHEDALQSGLTVAEALGSPPPWLGQIVPRSPAAHHSMPARKGDPL
ncbi:MAG: FAD-dependent oxidoreductase [Actinomycetota bacterium]|nr:FAD-dependent oxidoreductase [Actinomycetota bacterium]